MKFIQNKKTQDLMIILLRTFAIGPIILIYLQPYKDLVNKNFILPFYLFIFIDQFAQYIAGNNYQKKQPQKVFFKVVLYFILFLIACSFFLMSHNIWITILLLLYVLVSWFNYWQKLPFIESLFYPIYKALFEGVILNIVLFFLQIQFISLHLIYLLLPITLLYFSMAFLEQNIFARVAAKLNQIIYFTSFIIYQILLLILFFTHHINFIILLSLYAINGLFIYLYTTKTLTVTKKMLLIALLLFLSSCLLATNLYDQLHK